MAEIRFRGKRRLGELMTAQRESVGLNKGTLRRGSESDPRDDRPTLAEAGIDKHLADRARKFAAIPDGADLPITDVFMVAVVPCLVGALITVA
jgi:hypothetical protein